MAQARASPAWQTQAPGTDTAPYHLIPTPKRVRVRIGGTFVADSRDARILHVGTHPRTYAFPRRDVREDLLHPADRAVDDDRFGRVLAAAVRVDGRTIDGAARYHERPPGDPALADHVVFDWAKADAWYEEDEEVYVHPHDPWHRIDIRQSSRHVVVELEGETLAESRRPMLLFETGLPVRSYLPPTDVRLDLLRPSDKQTGCAYKGFASYHHVQVGDRLVEDLVWTYRTPLPEAAKVQGLLCFFDEQVDVTVDGARQKRPESPWS